MYSRCPLFSLTGRTTPPVRYGTLVFWACEGLIVIQNENPGKTGKGTYQTITPGQLQERVDIMVAYSKHRQIDEAHWQRFDRKDIFNTCQKLENLIKEAKAMGDPSDPQTQAFWRKHRRNSSVSLRAGSDAMGYPKLPELARGSYTGRTTGTADRVIPNSIYVPAQRVKKGAILLA